jgi:dihydroorotase
MTLTLKDPLDMHLHLRDKDMLKNIAKYSSKNFSGALIMPNLLPPITSIDALNRYKNEIIDITKDDNFTPYMTLFFQQYSYEFLEKIKDDIIAIKLYPAGVTTNSKNGISNFDLEYLRPTLDAMSRLGIVLCVHGESNGFVMDREQEFCKIYEKLASNFPKLKIIMEHITTKDSVDLLDRYENLFATITVHHLLITLDDVIGGSLDPHLFCKPIAKRQEDKEALLKVALNAHKKVMFGSDSAPHPRDSKEAPGCAAGIFTAPIALQMLSELFDNHNSLSNLQPFISDNAKNIYNIRASKKEIVLKKEEFIIEKSYDGVVPMWANKSLKWKIIS